MSKKIKVILITLTSVVLIALFFSGKQKKWYIADYDFEVLKEIDINVFNLSDCKLDVHVKNHSSIRYYLSPIIYSIETMHNGLWMYWAEKPLGRKTTGTLIGSGIAPNGDLNFEIDLGDHLPYPAEPGLCRITFFFVSYSGTVYQNSAYFNF